MAEFNKENFDQTFKKSITKIRNAEKETKAELLTLSRSVLDATHNTGDVQYMNRLLEVLTPMNKRTAVLYFKEFSGFTFDEERFTKKNKAHYDECLAKTRAFLEVPTNNIWSWAERHVDIEKKPIDIQAIERQVKNMLKKADDAGLKQSDVLRAMMKAGLTLQTLVEVMQTAEETEKVAV
jgi:flagellar hook-basal body complex protein FliE